MQQYREIMFEKRFKYELKINLTLLINLEVL